MISTLIAGTANDDDDDDDATVAAAATVVDDEIQGANPCTSRTAEMATSEPPNSKLPPNQILHDDHQTYDTTPNSEQVNQSFTRMVNMLTHTRLMMSSGPLSTATYKCRG